VSETEKKGTKAQMFFAALLLALVIVVPFAKRSLNNDSEFKSTSQPISAAELSAYKASVEEMVSRYTVRHEDGVPVVHPPAGADIYILAKNYDWGSYILELEQGASYRLHLATADVKHAIMIKQLNLKSGIEKDMVKIIEFRPGQAGSFSIVCGEFCGTRHGSMIGRLIVIQTTAGDESQAAH